MNLQPCYRVLTPLAIAAMAVAIPASAQEPDRVTVAGGVIEGTGPQPTGIREFKGIPYAQPPVGDMRWKAPAPVASWTGVKQTKQFGARCMQHPIFGDMNFRSSGMSEDCLFLNVWTPAKSAQEHLPVLVYYFGGGFVAGDGSEPRYDGESMAQKGIVVVTVNYRLGVFGFLAHPELTQESPHHASGNYTFLDQAAALRWVHDNIAALGGDPGRVTIGGESAGSVAVSALMASPVSRDLIAGAIGESGSILGALSAVPLVKAEATGVEFAKSLGAASIAAMRGMSTEQIFESTGKGNAFRFSPDIDGYFFPESPYKIYQSGKQAHVPLLAGWNSEEMTGRMLLGKEDPTVENYKKAVEKAYGAHAAEVLKEYPATSDSEVLPVATDLSGDRFIAYSTWKWLDLAAQTGGQPVYRYYYSRPRPAMTPEMGNATAGLAGGVIKGDGKAPAAPRPSGAVHSAEIEYALGNLSGNKVYAWTPDDYKVSSTMEDYFANFIKTGNPNGSNLARWPAAYGGDTVQVMHIDVTSHAEAYPHTSRYTLLDKLADSSR